jgi:PhnB protein
MTVKPQMSLAFDGQCETAFRLYERCFNGRITFMLRWAESPSAAEAPAGWEAKVYHATLTIGDVAIMGSDVPPGRYQPPQGVSLVLQMDDAAAAERIFQTLSERGRVEMPLQETHWASRFGSLVDRFGVPWSINCVRAGETA